MKNKKIIPYGVLTAVLFFPLLSLGEEVAPEQQSELVQLRKLLEKQSSQLEIQKKELDAMRLRFDKLQDRLQSKPEAVAKPVAPSTAPRESVAASEKAAVPAQQPVGQAPERPRRPPDVALASEQRGVLTPPGTLIVEPSLYYTNSSVHRVALEGFTIVPALTIGRIEIEKVNRDTYGSALAVRYGITPRFEIETKIPYVSRADTTQARPLHTQSEEDIIKSTKGEGLGDVELTLRYQMNQGHGGWPFLVGNLRVKSRTGLSPFDVLVDNLGLQMELPTGSGFWGVQPSITMIVPSDPAVIFANVSYLWNIERKIKLGYGPIEPGDAVGINFGMGLALNEKASFSLAYDLNVIGKSKQNDETIPRSQTIKVGLLMLGYAYRLTPDVSINVSIGAGLTADAPDMQLSVRMPMAFFSKAKSKR